MTELAVREESAPALPPVRAELAVPAVDDIDSWTRIVGSVIKLANEIYDTPFVPDGLRGSSAAVAAAILSGREMGLGPMTSLANIDVIRGKPTQKPLLMRGMIQSKGHAWEDIESSDVRAVVRGRRRGESGWTTVTFTAQQAKTAGLDLGKYPADKLYARASSRLAKHKFADVIMGMAYTSDDVEDGLDAEIAAVTDGEQPAAIEAPKPRTAQRRQRTQSPPPAPAVTPAATQPAPAGAGGDLPPLPGEDEPDPTTPAASAAGGTGTASSTAPPADARSEADDTDYDTPGTATTPQVTAIWTTLSMNYGFGKDEKDQARMVCAQITGRDLASSKDLSRNEAKAVLDTLAHWRAQAEEKGEHPRDYMIEVLVEQDNAGEVPGGE